MNLKLTFKRNAVAIEFFWYINGFLVFSIRQRKVMSRQNGIMLSGDRQGSAVLVPVRMNTKASTSPEGF